MLFYLKSTMVTVAHLSVTLKGALRTTTYSLTYNLLLLGVTYTVSYSLWSEILGTLFFAFFCATHVGHIGFVPGLGWRFWSIIL